MAVMPMKRIAIYALKNRRKQILELIQRRGVVEIDDRKADETVFAKMDTVPAKSRFENNAAALQSALDALDKLEPPKKSLFASLNGRDAIPLSKYQETADGAGELLKIASRINTLWKKCADNRAEILRLQTQIRALEPWMKLDISIKKRSMTSKRPGFLPWQISITARSRDSPNASIPPSVPVPYSCHSAASTRRPRPTAW